MMHNKVKRRRKIQTEMKRLGLKAGIPNDQLMNYVTNGLKPELANAVKEHVANDMDAVLKQEVKTEKYSFGIDDATRLIEEKLSDLGMTPVQTRIRARTGPGRLINDEDGDPPRGNFFPPEV